MTAKTGEIILEEAAKAVLAQNPSMGTLAQTMADIMAAFALPATTTTAPLAIKATDEQIAALDGFLDKVQAVAWPETVRKMETGEIANLTDLRLQMDEVEKIIKQVKENIKLSVYNHADEQAREDGRVNDNTLVDKEGHYVLEDRESFAVPGQAKMFARTNTNNGQTWGAPAVLGDRVKKLEDDGVISHEEYLLVTRQVRAVDEERYLAYLKKNPERASALGRIFKANPSYNAFKLLNNPGSPSE